MSDPITGAGFDGAPAGEPETVTRDAVAAPGSPAELGRVITDPAVRRTLYTAYTVIAAVATLVTVGFATGGAVPAWLGIANSVVAAAGAYAGFLAAANSRGNI